MKIHKEGYLTLAIVAVCLLLLNVLVYFLFSEAQNVRTGVGVFSFILFLAVASFFRIPRRRLHNDDNLVIAPADGKIVTIEEVFEPEYFKDRRIQVSIFMSPANVHVNRSPISGRVAYTKYHPGNYLVAWHPKSSTENERFTSVIVDEEQNFEILVRQIAGKVARKISNYLQVGEEIEQGNELGFIKFGSRVDIFLPLETSIKVSLKQKVVGGKTILAELPADD
ncbi:MAG: phosphatidylserine decarboxylase family protein [Sphingobacteriales bacterium]|nr:phosphatidylserine decarboxylase family protein [Sphingobacteriales bacterium]